MKVGDLVFWPMKEEVLICSWTDGEYCRFFDSDDWSYQDDGFELSYHIKECSFKVISEA